MIKIFMLLIRSNIGCGRVAATKHFLKHWSKHWSISKILSSDCLIKCIEAFRSGNSTTPLSISKNSWWYTRFLIGQNLPVFFNCASGFRAAQNKRRGRGDRENSIFNFKNNKSVRVACTFCTQHLHFFSFQHLNIYLPHFKCKHFCRFQATRTNLIIKQVTSHFNC